MEDERCLRYREAVYRYSCIRASVGFYEAFKSGKEFYREGKMEILEKFLFRIMEGRECAGELALFREAAWENLCETARDAEHAFVKLYEAQRKILEGKSLSVPAWDELADRILEYIMDGEQPGEMERRSRYAVGILPVYVTKGKFYRILEQSFHLMTGKPQFLLMEAVSAVERRIKGDIPGGNAVMENPESAAEIFRQDRMAAVRKEKELEKSVLLADALLLMALTGTGEGMEASVQEEFFPWAHEPLKDRHSVYGENFAAHLEKLERDARDEYESCSADGLSAFDCCIAGEPDNERENSDTGAGTFSERSLRAAVPALTEEIFRKKAGFSLHGRLSPAPASENRVDELLNGVIAAIDARIKKADRQTGQIIMAGVLSEVPVWFKTLEDAESYIYGSLSLCTDPVERELCRLGLEQIMVEEYALV